MTDIHPAFVVIFAPVAAAVLAIRHYWEST
jgi:hypothetical protein